MKKKKELEKILEEQNNDEELKKMAESDLNDLKNDFDRNEKLRLFLLPKDEADKKMQ